MSHVEAAASKSRTTEPTQAILMSTRPEGGVVGGGELDVIETRDRVPRQSPWQPRALCQAASQAEHHFGAGGAPLTRANKLCAAAFPWSAASLYSRSASRSSFGNPPSARV